MVPVTTIPRCANVSKPCAAHEQPETLLATQAEAARPTIKLDLADAPDETVGQTLGRCLLCALLNIRSAEALRQSPAVGMVWETFVCAALRHREQRAGRTGSLFFWRDRTREVDFVTDIAGRLELFEAKWREVPDAGDTTNLDFVRGVVGTSKDKAARP